MRGKHFSDEVRRKISEAKKGTKLSADTIAKLKARTWWTNGVEEKHCLIGPDGWHRGRKTSGKQPCKPVTDNAESIQGA